MSFDQCLASHAAAVERHLGELLSAASLAGCPERLAEAMRHAVLGGGKRFRPLLVIESAALFGLTRDEALNAASALELLHAYSLVHDDLPAMDDDALRHGKPTVWNAFGEASAILAGDALLTLAFEVLARPETAPDPGVRAALVLGLARAAGAGGMVGGQSHDLAAEVAGAGHWLRELDGTATIQRMKTGALIAFAGEAGAILGGATEHERSLLLDYGRRLGEAYQIADDILDVEGSAGLVGKAVGKDARAGKATFVSALGLAGAKARLARLEAEAVARLEPFGPSAAVLAEAARFASRRRQ